MNNSEYQKHEEAFLQDMASHLGLLGKPREVFLARFKDENESLNQGELESKFHLGTNAVSTYFSKHIYPALKQEGLDTKNWKEALLWLKKEKFPSWLSTPQELFEKLWNLGETDERKLDIKNLSSSGVHSLDFALIPNVTKNKRIRLGDRIKYHLNLQKSGYLLILEKFTLGEIYCLCPSLLAPDFYYSEGNLEIPTTSSEHQCLEIVGNVGIEQIVVVNSPTKPDWTWLPSQDDWFQPEQKHLKEVLNHCNNDENCQILRLQYQITG